MERNMDLLVESIPGEGTIIDIVLPSSAINIEPSFFPT